MTTDIDKICVNQTCNLGDVLNVINDGSFQIALVVDNEKRLIGTITDGDIRRGFLAGLNMSSSIETLIFRQPTIAYINDDKQEVLKKALAKKLHQIPIVDDDLRVVGIFEIEDLVQPAIKSNKVILMAGGLGTRLRPLTVDTPKPMLHVGSKPILQTIVEQLAFYGFINIIMCVNYKSHIIQEYFKDGADFGVNIEYITETSRMGTAGSLSLLSNIPTEPFFVMNADLLTNVNFEQLLNHHLNTSATATMCVREYDFQVPYGVVNIKNNKIISIEEKPTHKFFVSAGIYMLSPESLRYIPQNAFYDMPTLFESLISDGKNVSSFQIKEHWLDIGRMEEYEKANSMYHEIF